MTGNNNKKANVLVTFTFPDNSNFTMDFPMMSEPWVLERAYQIGVQKWREQ